MPESPGGGPTGGWGESWGIFRFGGLKRVTKDHCYATLFQASAES